MRFAPFAVSIAVTIIATSGFPLVTFAQTQVWGTATIRDGHAADVQAAQGLQGKRGVQVYGTTGTVGQRAATRTAQSRLTAQGGTTFYGPDGQVIGVSPGMHAGPVYAPAPYGHPHPPVSSYPPQPYPPQRSDGYQHGPQHGHSDGHPYGPNVVPGWGAQPAPDYHREPRRSQPGYYLPR